MLRRALLLFLLAASVHARPQEAEPDVARSIAALIPEAIQEGDLAGAREMLREAVEALKEPEPSEEKEHVALLLELDGFARRLGSLQQQLRLCEEVLAIRTRLLPPDHADLLAAQQTLATTRHKLGDLQGARELFEAIHEARTRLLPPDHPDLFRSKLNLAVARRAQGDLDGARELEEAVHEAWTRLLPPDNLDLLSTKLNLGVTRRELGDIEGAHELFEAVVVARTRLLPPDHSDLLSAQMNLAVTRGELGDLMGAHELKEAVLSAMTRSLPPDHPDLLAAQQTLATTRHELGDLQGARELFEAIHEARTRLLPPDHPDLFRSKLNLAVARRAQGDLDGARELEEAVHEAWTRLLPPDHLDLLSTKSNLAITRSLLGDSQGAKELFEAVLEARSRLLPADHPDLLGAQLNLAVTRSALGDLAGARELEEVVLEARSRLLPPDHSNLLSAKLNLAGTRLALGDLGGARELVSSLLAGMRVRGVALGAEATRPAREGARAELRRFAVALFLAAAADPERKLEPELFATLEMLRHASAASAEAAFALASRPELAELARSVAAVRSSLNDLVAVGPADAAAAGSWRQELLQLAEKRDRGERGLRRRLSEAGVFVDEIEAQAVGAQLASGAAAVSFLRYEEHLENVDSLLAFVVRRDGSVQRIELGAAAELEALVQDWRASLGKQIERGIAAEVDEERSEAELGRGLRERVLDPVLTAAGEGVNTLHVVLDDLLFLVPLDALPLDGETRVGERIRVHVEPTLARLLRARRPVAEDTKLVVVGGVDFDAEATVAVGQNELGTAEPAAKAATGKGLLLAASTPPLERSGRPEAFEPLRQTRYEVEDVGAQYEEAFESEPVLLTRTEATKARLRALAPKTRYLHLATHGWFASESFKSQLDTVAEASSRETFDRAQETLTGFAPETLCGLALSGANRGKDALGRVAGILTAEELASFDLRNCELAVLSACETNVGIRRAGQGIQSLQTALHAAGARTAITSLWKVDDAATRRLFELFYTKLWQEKLGKHEALWQAKMALRAEGHPPRDWAGWVLSGDPD